jgi:hypothetical protein
VALFSLVTAVAILASVNELVLVGRTGWQRI